MAKWANKQIFILKKLFLPIASATLVFFAIEIAFHFFERAQQKAVWQSVTALLRNETDLANSYQLSRTLRDMEVANWINCVVLKETTPSERYFYDSSHREGCAKSSGLLSGNLASLNNNQWYLEFKPVRDAWLNVTHNLLRIMLLGLFLGLIYYYLRKNRHDEARTRRIEFERQWLMDLANQTQHDVASPISALRAISKSNQLPAGLKSFLNQAIERTETIFLDLQKAKNPEKASPLEKVNVVETIQEIIAEKREIQKVPISFEPNSQFIEILGTRPDFSRVISNLLNNSSESFSKDSLPEATINVSITQNQNSTEVRITDNGRGMAPETLAKLGSKGFTHGKLNGSGLGFWHAQNTIKSWGGKLTVKSQEGVGTEVALLFQ